MNFQTPPHICDYMSSFIPYGSWNILEPTCGEGNLVRALQSKGTITAPEDFFALRPQEFDFIVMNPPFTPMEQGYRILYSCMGMSDNIIALMPWLTMINSEKRTKKIMDFGLKSITHLPRNVFKGARVQCCILELKRQHRDETIFRAYDGSHV